MNNFLSSNRINYVLEHLQQTVDIEPLKNRIVYLNNISDIDQYDNKIIFLLSNQKLDLNNIVYKHDIPILFPVLKTQSSIFSIQGSNLIFNHDVLKSAFFLLSGYQELDPEYKGTFNRFPYEISVQYKLCVVQKPLVNYYFEFIREGLTEFCEKNQLELKSKAPFKTFGFFLTHDIDTVDKYTIYDLVYYLKVLLGLRKKDITYYRKIKKAIQYVYHYLFTSKNPSWDFDFLRSTEEKFHFKSAFYFLPRDLKHQDAYYSFKENRLQKLFKRLKEEYCEIGIHGTNRSAAELKYLKSNIDELREAAHCEISGIRQHRLLFDMNITPHLHQKVNLLYDTSLGFAEHDGFRNAYCYPFKLYNFKEEKPFNTWEIPLNVMDATLFEYRKLTASSAFESVKNIITEVQKFNGIFTLLWHNGYFDEVLNPGITRFYIDLLEYIYSLNAESILGKNIKYN